VKLTNLSGVFAGFVVAVATGGAANAEPVFGARHQVVISAEHLAGATRTTASELSGAESDAWLFGSGNRTNPGYGRNSPYSASRAGFDFFVADRWSVGTSLLLSRLGQPHSWQVVLGPRVGAALPLSPHWNLWGRLGFTYVHQNDDQGALRFRTTLYAITVEAPFVATLGGNFFLSVAPTANVGVGGSVRYALPGPPDGEPSPAREIRRTELGLQAALGGFF
jgi:hypothetical protein